MNASRYRDLRILDETFRVLAYFQGSLPLPQRMFLQQLVTGILCSRSCQLSEIARTLVVPSVLQNEYHRLDECLGKYDLHPAYERAQSLVLSEIDTSHLFIFDPSEVVKPFAKKMEALALVRDGSEKPRKVKDPKTGQWKEQSVLKPGYSLRVAIAMDASGGLLPVELSLYSAAEERFRSVPDENVQALDTLLQRTHFQPTLVLDQEFDAFAIFRHLMELRQKFIVRVGPDRKFLRVDAPRSPHEQTFDRKQMIEKHCFLAAERIISFTAEAGKTKPALCRLRAARVKLLSEQKKSESFRDLADEDALMLVELKLHRVQGVPTLYLLTSTRPQTEPDLLAVGLGYLARWNVEEYIRFFKQHFDLENFLVRDLGRMRNLVSAVYLATVLLHVITDTRRVSYSRGRRNHWHLLEQALSVNSRSDERKGRDFFLYAYGRGLSEIIRRNHELLASLNSAPRQAQHRAA